MLKNSFDKNDLEVKVKKHMKKIFILALMSCFMLAACGKGDDGQQENLTLESAEITENEAKNLSLPTELECGLTVNSMFTYSGFNPDFNGEEGADIGTLEVINTSGKYLERAKIQVCLTDGQIYSFLLEDIPVDSTVYAFNLENISYNDERSVQKIEADASYLEEDDSLEDQILVSVSAMDITLQNQGDDSLKNVTVTYHNVLDGILFGGLSYEQTVEEIEGDSEVTIFAAECWIGQAEVVHINN